MRGPTLRLASLLALAACGPASTQTPKEVAMTDATAPQPAAAPTWSVWDRHFRVMTVVGRPGPVLSMAAPPPGPGEMPRPHSYLSATSSSPVHEDRIGRLLAASPSLAAFLQALRDAGFEVREEEPTPP